jgi:hypothetical protein
MDQRVSLENQSQLEQVHPMIATSKQLENIQRARHDLSKDSLTVVLTNRSIRICLTGGVDRSLLSIVADERLFDVR